MQANPTADGTAVAAIRLEQSKFPLVVDKLQLDSQEATR